jgi:precorrin-8X/cobalt-precorrin-8 methylmutase
MKPFITDPIGIEAKSMRIIAEELGIRADRFSERELALVKRIIHTTADFEYAELFTSSPEAVEDAVETFSRGDVVIVSDTNMIVAGVNKSLLQAVNARLECLVAEEETKKAALEEGLTRSMINIRRTVEKYPRAVFAIGNAPTALYELLRLAAEGKASPALVIGVPVGFVEATESKEALLETDLPYIAISGRKGGSTVAVAIINALLKLAAADE